MGFIFVSSGRTTLRLVFISRLKEVKDVDVTGPDGQSIRGRLEGLSETTANDIKTCANTCDTYKRKKLIVKIISSPRWNGKLAGFVELFTKRRKEFE